MTLKDIIALYDQAFARQNTYWNFHWIVAIALLAFLWKEPHERKLKNCLVISYLVFALTNLYAISSFQWEMGRISDAVSNYLKANPTAIDPTLLPAFDTLRATPVYQVVLFHSIVTTILTVSTC